MLCISNRITAPSPSRKSVDDDCPADDDEPKKSSFHSVVTKIGTLKKFKNVVTRCEIKVKNWRLRVEERKKAKEEKKSKKTDKKIKKSKDNHDDSDSEDEPKKMLRVSLRLKSKKAKKDVREVFKSDQDGNESDTEVETKPKKKTIRAASPMLVETPKSTIEVEMKDSANHTDAEPDASGDETETEKTRKKVFTKDEKKGDEKTKEEKEEKDTKKEKDEKTTKKHLSILSIESLCNIKEDDKEEKDMKKKDMDDKEEKDNKDSMKEEEDDKENKDDEKKEDKIDIDEMIEDKIEDSSAASIKDIDMFDDDSANNDDTRSIKSSASSEEMDLDDNKTIRGDDDDTEVVMIADGSGAFLLAPWTGGDAMLIGEKRNRAQSPKKRTSKPPMLRRKSLRVRTVLTTPSKPQPSASHQSPTTPKSPLKKQTTPAPSPKALKRRSSRLIAKVMTTRQQVRTPKITVNHDNY
jgi:hypothetical protein